jgi:hypothetical protein
LRILRPSGKRIGPSGRKKTPARTVEYQESSAGDSRRDGRGTKTI